MGLAARISSYKAVGLPVEMADTHSSYVLLIFYNSSLRHALSKNIDRYPHTCASRRDHVNGSNIECLEVESTNLCTPMILAVLAVKALSLSLASFS